MRHPNSHPITQTAWWILLLALLAVIASSRLAHGEEKFTRFDRASGASVELRQEATIMGQEIRFRQIVRYADADKDVFEPLADLIVARIGDKQAVRSIAIAELRNLLRDAGVNASMMNFVGSTTCTITRSDVQVAQGQTFEQLVATKSSEKNANNASEKSAVVFAGSPDTKAASASHPADITESPVQTLQALLTADVASRLRLPIDSLQVTFRGEDDKLLRLSEPQFRFSIDPQRAGNLGEVSWQVTISSDSGSTKSFIQARAQAWQNQLVVNRPLATKQLITDGDLVDRRTLVDRMTDDPLLTREQVVGQQAARELKAGTVMTGRLVDAVQLVRPGQFVTIEHSTGAVRVKIVARAIDGGCYGQSIRVKNETTREIIRVTVVGPQQASINPPDLSDKGTVAMGAH